MFVDQSQQIKSKLQGRQYLIRPDPGTGERTQVQPAAQQYWFEEISQQWIKQTVATLEPVAESL